MSKDIIDIDIINEEKPKSKRGRKPKDKTNEVPAVKDEKKKKSSSKIKADDELNQKDIEKSKKKIKSHFYSLTNLMHFTIMNYPNSL